MITGDRETCYELECDICGEGVSGFETFYDAVDYKKENDWKSVIIDGVWQDRCPDCKNLREK